MLTDKQDYEKYQTLSGGSLYIELKSTLKLFIKEKKWLSLKEVARNTITLFPEEDFGWFAVGMALSRLGEYKAAVINLRKALYLNPSMVSADYQLGITFYRQRNYLKAIQHYKAALTNGMNTKYLHYNLGNVWYKLNHNEAAIQCYNNSLNECSCFTPAAYGLFRIYFDKNNYQKAVSSLSSFISDGKLPIYLLSRAKLLYRNESEINPYNLRKALKLLSCAIDLDDSFALAYYERAFVKSKQGDLEGFFRDRTTAFQLNAELRKGHTFELFSA